MGKMWGLVLLTVVFSSCLRTDSPETLPLTKTGPGLTT